MNSNSAIKIVMILPIIALLCVMSSSCGSSNQATTTQTPVSNVGGRQAMMEALDANKQKWADSNIHSYKIELFYSSLPGVPLLISSTVKDGVVVAGDVKQGSGEPLYDNPDVNAVYGLRYANEYATAEKLFDSVSSAANSSVEQNVTISYDERYGIPSEVILSSARLDGFYRVEIRSFEPL